MRTVDCPKCGGSGQIVDNRELASQLRQLRLKSKKTLRFVAKKMGISAGYLSDLERGNRPWKYERELAFKAVVK